MIEFPDLPAQSIFHLFLPYEFVWVLPTEVDLYYRHADDDIAQEDLSSTSGRRGTPVQMPTTTPILMRSKLEQNLAATAASLVAPTPGVYAGAVC